MGISRATFYLLLILKGLQVSLGEDEKKNVRRFKPSEISDYFAPFGDELELFQPKWDGRDPHTGRRPARGEFNPRS